MGKTKTSSQHSSSSQSSLANTQEAILKSREKIFEDYFLPEFKSFYSSLSPDFDAGKAQLGLNAQQINASFDSAQKQTNQAMAQQGISGSGANLAMIAANNRARSSALANAYAQQMAESTKNKGTALAQLGTMMPSPTSAAPILTSSTGSGYSNVGISSMI